MNSHTSRKRLVKNTMFMYFRMFFLMIISFYTSRVVLQTLGETDFGIFNAVGGFVVLFTFVNGAMTSGTQRHLSYELGKERGNVSKIFSACLIIHLIIAFFIVFLTETIGLWFLNSKMNFPEDRMAAVNWVYQLSIVTCVVNIVRIPYNALIIAYEKLSFYAYAGIVEGLLKMVIVYLLVLFNYDFLIQYSFLVLLVSILLTFAFFWFCSRSFPNVFLFFVKDLNIYRSLVSFSGWTLFGSIANVGRSQGINILINIYYGVALNAAIGIANQVNAGISQFLSGFQQAFNPQLTKAEAAKDRNSQFQLIILTAKFSFFVVFFFALPILYGLDYLLSFWLGDYPLHTSKLCFWIVITTLLESISGPLWMTIFATGSIKEYQLVVSITLFFNLVIAFLFCDFGFAPHYCFISQSVISLLVLFQRLLFLKKLISFSIKSFVYGVLLPIIIISVLSIIYLVLILGIDRPVDNGLDFLTQSGLILLGEFVIIMIFGFNSTERMNIYNLFRRQ